MSIKPATTARFLLPRLTVAMQRKYPGFWVIRPEVLPSIHASGFSSDCHQLQLRGQHRHCTDFLAIHGWVGLAVR